MLDHVAKVSRSEAEHYQWGGVCDGWHLLKQEQLSVIEERVPPGAGEIRHYHGSAQQFFYVLAGEVVIELGHTQYRLGAGEGLHIPPHHAHTLRNESSSDARFLAISNPPSHGDRVDLP